MSGADAVGFFVQPESSGGAFLRGLTVVPVEDSQNGFLSRSEGYLPVVCDFDWVAAGRSFRFRPLPGTTQALLPIFYSPDHIYAYRGDVARARSFISRSTGSPTGETGINGAEAYSLVELPRAGATDEVRVVLDGGNHLKTIPGLVAIGILLYA